MMRIRSNPSERRKELLDISMDLFCSHGYTQTTVQDICKKAGIAKGTFFYYFPTKEDVLREIFKAWTIHFVHEFSQKAKTLDAVPQLRIFLHICARNNSIEPFVDKLLEEGHRDLVMQIWQRMIIRVFTPLLHGIVEKGNEEGTMCVHHIEESLLFFWGIIDVLWSDEDTESIDKEHMAIRSKIASKMMEDLLGIERGRLDHFDETT